jgi:hypothetical protein
MTIASALWPSLLLVYRDGKRAKEAAMTAADPSRGRSALAADSEILKISIAVAFEGLCRLKGHRVGGTVHTRLVTNALAHRMRCAFAGGSMCSMIHYAVVGKRRSGCGKRQSGGKEYVGNDLHDFPSIRSGKMDLLHAAQLAKRRFTLNPRFGHGGRASAHEKKRE